MFNVEQGLGFSLAKANQRITAIFKEEFYDYGITPRQFILLAILWETDGLSQTELSIRTNIDMTTVGGIVDRLEKAKFLDRKPSRRDRRIHRVWLTERGRSYKEVLCLAAYRVRNRISGRITTEEYSQLKELLTKLLT